MTEDGTPTPSGEAEIGVLLAEFQITSGEIANRSQAQHILLNISIVGVGATTVYVLGAPNRAIFALVLSFLTSFLGAIWLDHARVITSKGIYISSNLWPRMRERLNAENLPSHEDWARRQDADLAAWLAFVLPLVGVFVLPAIAGVAYSFPHVSGFGGWLAWATGVLVTILSLAYWVAYYFNHTVLTYIGPPYTPKTISIEQAGSPDGHVGSQRSESQHA